MSTWRDKCRSVISGVIASIGTSDMKALRKALREAYPFGPYEYHPKKIWLSEIRRQLGLERDKRLRAGERKPVKPDAKQLERAIEATAGAETELGSTRKGFYDLRKDQKPA